MEAVATGMPIVCWPLEAELWMNKIYIVEEMKVGIEVRGYKPGKLVTTDNVDARVKQIGGTTNNHGTGHGGERERCRGVEGRWVLFFRIH
jgi:hypothetical protein